MSESQCPSTIRSLAVLSFFKTFLDEDEILAVFRQMDDLLPTSNTLATATLGLDTSTPDTPQFVLGETRFAVDESTTHLLEFTQEYQMYAALAQRYALTVEQYPLRAAALNIRILAMILAPLFEKEKLQEVDDAFMEHFVTLVLHAEALILQGNCSKCPHSTYTLA